VGHDLRFLASTLRVIGEIEKIADDAVKLARRGAKLGGQIPVDMKITLSDLGETGRQMLGAALRLYDDYSGDLDREIVELERQTDDVYFKAKQNLVETMRANPQSAEVAVRTMECLQALEHVADRASEITKHLRTHFGPAVAR
ncbi:MAG: phosphate uptake regulator PhoU, partial [Fimbriimonadaceae bacterium]